jgi:hypothetical protein
MSAYERRIAAYLAKHPGATRQEARGHKAKEHVTRREREQQRIDDFAMRQAYRGENRGARDADAIADAIRERIRTEGFGWFSRLERFVNSSNARYRQQGQPSGRERVRIADLDEAADDFDWPAEELFYH